MEIRDDLSEEDTHFINSEIERYMKKCGIKREGIKYYAETWPGRGLHAGVEFCIRLKIRNIKTILSVVIITAILKVQLMSKTQS